MIFNAGRKELLAQVSRAAIAASSAGVLPILSGIKLEADERMGTLRVTATNLEVTIRVIAPASIETSGEAIVDARLMRSILEKLTGEDVYAEHRDGHVTIRSGQSSFVIPVLPGDYPEVTIPAPGQTISVSGIKTLAKKSVFASSKDSSRPMLRCVNLVLDVNGLRALASNGFCVTEASGDKECRGNASMLVPASSLKMLASICADSDVFEMGITGEGGKSIVFNDGMLMFSSRLVDDTFPEMDSHFNSFAPMSEAVVSAGDMKNGLANIRALSRDSKYGGIAFERDGIALSCQDGDVSATVLVKAKVTGVSEKKRSFNATDLLACVSVLSGDITLSISKQGNILLNCAGVRYFQLGVREARPAGSKKTEPRTRKPAA